MLVLLAVAVALPGDISCDECADCGYYGCQYSRYVLRSTVPSGNVCTYCTEAGSYGSFEDCCAAGGVPAPPHSPPPSPCDCANCGYYGCDHGRYVRPTGGDGNVCYTCTRQNAFGSMDACCSMTNYPTANPTPDPTGFPTTPPTAYPTAIPSSSPCSSVGERQLAPGNGKCATASAPGCSSWYQYKSSNGKYRLCEDPGSGSGSCRKGPQFTCEAGELPTGSPTATEWTAPNGATGWVQLGADVDGEAARDWAGGANGAVALSKDGTVLAVGSPGNDASGDGAGHVRVFELVNGAWQQRGAAIEGEAAARSRGSSLATAPSLPPLPLNPCTQPLLSLRICSSLSFRTTEAGGPWHWTPRATLSPSARQPIRPTTRRATVPTTATCGSTRGFRAHGASLLMTSTVRARATPALAWEGLSR